MAKPSAEDFLAHHGVLGMHWGSHKATPEAAKAVSGSTPKPKRLSRRAAKNAFYQEKANRLLNTALKDPSVLIALNTGGMHPTVVTGKEFVHHLSQGGLMNVKYTDVYATKQGDHYVMNENPNPKFKRG